MEKFCRDRNSRIISSHINAHTGNTLKNPVFYTRDFSCNVLIPKLPNSYTRGL